MALAAIGMTRDLPAQNQIQEWISDIRPYPYFERLVDSPGLLVLRAKTPRCEYRGIHVALSDRRRNEFVRDLRKLLSTEISEIKYRASYPDGRAWFNLYTSGINFGNWHIILFSLDHSVQDGEFWVQFTAGSIVSFHMSTASLTTIIDNLSTNPDGGRKSALRILRTQKPASEPHHLWFWSWREHDASR